MFKEFDVVIAKNELPTVPKGSVGTILIVYESGHDYEVEFLDSEGNTIDLLTVNEKDLEKNK